MKPLLFTLARVTINKEIVIMLSCPAKQILQLSPNQMHFLWLVIPHPESSLIEESAGEFSVKVDLQSVWSEGSYLIIHHWFVTHGHLTIAYYIEFHDQAEKGTT